MKGLCPECGNMHSVIAGCYSLLIEEARDENDQLTEQRRWDEWYASFPPRLKARLSIEDFKRLGDLFKQVFNV